MNIMIIAQAPTITLSKDTYSFFIKMLDNNPIIIDASSNKKPSCSIDGSMFCILSPSGFTVIVIVVGISVFSPVSVE